VAAKIIVTSRFELIPGSSAEILPSLQDSDQAKYFFDLAEKELLQLRSYDSLTAFSKDAGELSIDLQRFTPYMVADVKRELITHVETVKGCASELPETDYIQLRHVEVPPVRFDDYRAWRARTIFEVVIHNSVIADFAALLMRDAIIEALLSTRIADKSRDPEMHRRRSALKKRTWTRYEDSPLRPRSMTAYFVDVLFCFCRARTSRTIWLRTNAPSALITCPEVSFLRAGFGADRENPLEATD
jgi:hypothetical protein